MSRDQVLAQAMNLSLDDRAVLANAIWDSIEQEAAASDLTDEQRAELDRRLATLRDDPEAGESWDVVKQRLLNELRGT